MNNHIINKIESKESVIGILGLGYVGLPLFLRYIEVGFNVIGFDIDHEKINKLGMGKSYIGHISSARVQEAHNKGYEVTIDFSRITEADALILCVPTPLNKYREPDLSFVVNTIEMAMPYLRNEQVISLESTTYPGTSEEELLPRIESTGLVVGKDIFLVYSPEREDPGNPDFATHTIPKVVGGHTQACLEVGSALYSSVINQIVPVSSTRTAEMTKLLENIYRAVNIGLVNEMKIVADRMGIDIHEVVRAASTKPFGFTPFYPGPGLGGHCIPIDPFYLTWKAKEYGLSTRFIELAGEVNTNMPRWVTGKVMNALNECGKAIKDSKILILGISYKKNIDDMRESPAVELMELLQEKGAQINYTDPHVPTFPRMREHYFDLKSVELTPEKVQEYDLLLLVTNHDKLDYQLLQENAQLIIDTRGVFDKTQPNVVVA